MRVDVERTAGLEETEEAAWSLSYGDLMSLLLAVFVLIAAMSEIREGEKFDSVSRSVRAAFGFPVAGDPEEAEVADPDSVPALLRRIEAIGMEARKPLLGLDESDAAWSSCSIVQRGSTLRLRLFGPEVFAENGANLETNGTRIVEWLADYLAERPLAVEIRGYRGQEEVPEHVAYAGGRDLAYARARQVADLLEAGGIAPDRLIVSTWNRSAFQDVEEDAWDAVDMEIIVYAEPTAGHDHPIAAMRGS